MTFEYPAQMLVACPICGGQLGRPEDRKPTFRKDIPIQYSHCPDCDGEFLNPMFGPDWLRSFYSDGGYRLLVNHKPGVAPTVLDGQAIRARMVMAFVVKRLSAVRSCMDIGCGGGALLSSVQKCYDCAVFGAEWDASYAEHAKKNGIAAGPEMPPGPFDLVTAVHVLEHQANPMWMLREIAQRLDRGGHLYVEVPYRQWDIVHCIAFDETSLKTAVERAGLHVIETHLLPNPGRVICWAEK